MISRLFFRLRAWLIIFIFLSLTISVPHAPAPDEVPVGSATEMTAYIPGGDEEAVPEVGCLLEIIIEESFGLFHVFRESSWPSEDMIVASEAGTDIISQIPFTAKFYPPKPRRLLAMNHPLPDEQYAESLIRPPEMKQ